MKKILLLIIISIVLVGCSKKVEVTKEQLVESTMKEKISSNIIDMEKLKKLYPEFFEIEGEPFKGVEIYVWQMAKDSYRCGLMFGTNRNKTDKEIWSLQDKSISIEEAKALLDMAGIQSKIVFPIAQPYSSYYYEIDDEYKEKVRKLFMVEEEVTNIDIKEKIESNQFVMKGIVTSINGATINVKPIDGSKELNSSDNFTIPIGVFKENVELKIDDIVSITYDGFIQETYPAQFGNILSAIVVENNKEKNDDVEKSVSFNPLEIHDLASVEIHEDFGDIVVDDKNALAWIEKHFGNATKLNGWPNCSYGLKVILKRNDGVEFVIEPAIDSCDNIKVGDEWYKYNAIDNSEFYKLFGIKVLFGNVEFLDK